MDEESRVVRPLFPSGHFGQVPRTPRSIGPSLRSNTKTLVPVRSPNAYQFGTGFCFTVVYAALLTKTNRISRIFNASKHSAKRPILISPSSQLAICAALVSIQVLIVVVWMIVAPARAMFHYPTREDNMLVCDSYVDASYMIAFFYPIVLILVCTVYAVLTRKIPEAFNESKHIGEN
ncbi:hypothetical protein evm_014619 [Chilo suppressalis]|nr:hypothetical protein evm_014619 [Chilo suppressalis]